MWSTNGVKSYMNWMSHLAVRSLISRADKHRIEDSSEGQHLQDCDDVGRTADLKSDIIGQTHKIHIN